MGATPDTFRGVLRNAENCYQEALNLLSEKTPNGFTRLVTHDEIDTMVERLSNVLGGLQAKMDELKPDGQPRKNYQNTIDKLDDILKKFRKKQVKRNHKPCTTWTSS